MRYIIAYLAAALTLGVLDYVWLTNMADRLYRPVIGSIMADQPDMRAALAFYLIYLFGIVFIAVAPALKAGSLTRAVVTGAVLGFVAYATYDLTNQATLKVWALHITLIDIAWGTFITATTAAVAYLAAQRFG
jgi:uncharacterized membrane protein